MEETAAAKALRLEQIGLLEEKKNMCGWRRVVDGESGSWERLAADRSHWALQDRQRRV